MLVEVGEHLLAPLQAHILKEYDRDALAAELGPLLVCRTDGRVPVLAVVYEDGSVYGYAEYAHVGRLSQTRRRVEDQLAAHRDCDGREDVAVWVA